MKTLEYKPRLAQEYVPVVSSDLGLDLSMLETVENPNVRGVALSARDIREKLESDPFYEIQGTYSEAYSGERA